MNHMRKLGQTYTITLPSDDEGMIGRECPVSECEGYFKIQPGTGLEGEELPCHCPYCGHGEGPDKFFTKAQIEYAKSIVLREVTGALLKDLKSLEFNHRPRGAFGIGISMKVTGQPTSIRHYRESKLETEIACDKCTLRYTIYGVFGFCPDCASHNSLQILIKNFELVGKLLELADTQEPPIARQLIENALEDCVSAFDGFGRETCRIFASKAQKPEKAIEIRFQNIMSARDRVKDQFRVDFAALAAQSDWALVLKGFQKRHLLAHKMGVIDEEYISATGELQSLLGRRVSISSAEVRSLFSCLQVLGRELFRLLQAKT